MNRSLTLDGANEEATHSVMFFNHSTRIFSYNDGIFNFDASLWETIDRYKIE